MIAHPEAIIVLVRRRQHARNAAERKSANADAQCVDCRMLCQEGARAEEIGPKTISPAAVAELCHYSWPGNVRQLENAIEMAVALSADRRELTPEDFPVPAQAEAKTISDPPVVSVPDSGLDYERTLAWIERSILQQALLKTGGNKKAAAAMLHLKRTTLSAKVRSLDASAA